MSFTNLKSDLLDADLIAEHDIITINNIEDEVNVLDLSAVLQLHKQVFNSELGELKLVPCYSCTNWCLIVS